MKHRTWITEALRLHFEEHLPQVLVGRRGRTKTISLWYVRALLQSWLFWPLPAGMSERELDGRLYGSTSTVPVVLCSGSVIQDTSKSC